MFSIEPSGINNAVPYELKAYKMIISNNGSLDAEGINILLKADNGLVLVVNGKEFKERKFYIKELKADETAALEFEVKAVSENLGERKITASCDINGNLCGTIEARLNVINAKLKIKEQLSFKAEKDSIKASIKVDAENISEERLEGITMELYGSDGVVVENTIMAFEYLEAGDKIPSQQFEAHFSKEEGKREIIIKVRYIDSEGTHIVEKRHSFEEKGAGFYILIATALVILALGINYYLKSRKEGNKE